MEANKKTALSLSKGTIAEAHRRATISEPSLTYRAFLCRVRRGKNLAAIRLVREVEEELQQRKKVIAEEIEKIKKTAEP